MPKTKISEFSATPANNTDIDSINIAEGCAPSGINDAIRELMAQLKDFQTGAVGDSFNGPVGTTTAAAGAFTTLSASGAVTLSGGTANGVAYLNGSKVVTSGSALTFDGTNLGIGASSPLKPLDITFAGTSGARRFLVSYDDSVITIKGANASNDPEAIRITGDNIRFNTGTSGSGSEQMRLTSTGLGIGTSSPAYKLDVNGNAQVGNATAATNRSLFINGVANKAGRIIFQESGVDKWYIGNGAASENGNFEIYNANGNNTVLTPAGNLGLGVTPSAWASGTYKAFQIFGGGAVSGSSGQVNFSQNFVGESGGEKYIATAAASSYSQVAGSHRWFTAPSGTAGNAITFTQAMTLDASGRLLVGTTSSIGTASVGRLQVLGGETFVTTNSEAGGFVGVNSNADNSLAIVADLDNLRSGSHIAFYVDGFSEKARIDSSGNLLIGTTSTSSSSGTGFKVLANLGVSGHFDPSVVTPSNNTSQSCWDIYSTGVGAYRFYVTSSGVVNAVSTTITAISDQRLKENIRDIDTGLDSVLSLKPRRFDWKNGKGQDKKNAAGFIAQEFETVFPDSVGISKAGEDGVEYKNICHEELIPTLVKAIQEMKSIIDDQAARIATLEAK